MQAEASHLRREADKLFGEAQRLRAQADRLDVNSLRDAAAVPRDHAEVRPSDAEFVEMPVTEFIEWWSRYITAKMERGAPNAEIDAAYGAFDRLENDRREAAND
jgi:hypothetical protein